MSALADFRFKLGRILAASLYQLVQFEGDPLRLKSSVLSKESSQSDNEKKIILLRRILQRFPYWSGGHLVLGALQLSERMQRAAFSSAMAAKKLRGDSDVEARYLLARVYLSSGRCVDALTLLELLHQQLPLRYDVIEDLAAAQMQNENNFAALTLLEKIPEQMRSKHSEVVLSHLRQKIQ
jgi:cytochrome c-type biogenesis protein CcmH/NrfG